MSADEVNSFLDWDGIFFFRVNAVEQDRTACPLDVVGQPSSCYDSKRRKNAYEQQSQQKTDPTRITPSLRHNGLPASVGHFQFRESGKRIVQGDVHSLYDQEIIRALLASGSTVRLRQDRRESVLESGAVRVRVFKAPILPQKGKENHQVNHGDTGGKYLEAIVPFLAG